MKKKFQFLFFGHNVPITWSEVLGVNKQNEALGQSFTQRYGTSLSPKLTELWGQNETSQHQCNDEIFSFGVITTL